MRKFPEWTSGSLRDERRLMVAVPGLLIKAGAEGVDAFALADGSAAVVKIEDGEHWARTPVTVAALRLLGAVVPDELATVPVIGGEAVVGVIRAVSSDHRSARRCSPSFSRIGGFTFGHLIDALDTEFCRLGAIG